MKSISMYMRNVLKELKKEKRRCIKFQALNNNIIIIILPGFNYVTKTILQKNILTKQ